MNEFSLKIWGVRGSTAAAGPETLRYGGETTCFEIRAGDVLLMVDCGSGARNLGKEMMRGPHRDIDLLFTHTHLDHICGLPFFEPAYDPNFRIRLTAGHFSDPCDLKDIICRIMSPPIFPVGANTLSAVSFKSFNAGDTLKKDNGLIIKTVALNHPGGACGYRMEYNGKAMCIITDHEMGSAHHDAAVLDFIRDADVVIQDGMYTSAEYPKYKGWGHSTWEHVVGICQRANVKTPVIFHHDPRRTDDELDEIGLAAQQMHPRAIVASEGMVFKP
ncbi:beta-lactamase domain protein [Pseudovibrio sp. FO-BEG1]|uniref:Phosphoribosyl 1,2-cyclic phosphodiesterase n=1 Tax=Pseudovibrio denitrificans TaxID=258256 RepID=A0A1I6YB78_9HYPH|nr:MULTISPECIES: MBL fold metallo-hydrolase [Pseudovibrio]AEV37013.1 beta-lactamase domain protein [Pseudovibrio sp. FO-BEG1]EEA94463.1 metal dependant beta lactamase protein [Pseudovibrio sp. JE062]SFT47786.1 Phosphoribosyl 1,2-cyclic phosphodiesterase [Pseudovibrio denitrificans]